MNEILHKDFGKCIVPEGCFLFRKAADEKIYPTMFFGFEVAATYATEIKTSNVQVWKVKEDITCLFPIREIALNQWHISSLEDLCVKYTGLAREDAYYLAIKKNDNHVRTALIKFLQSNGIYSWVSDLEGKIAMELFIFNDPIEIAKQIEYKGFLQKDDPKRMDYNYYEYVKIIHNPAIIKSLY